MRKLLIFFLSIISLSVISKNSPEDSVSFYIQTIKEKLPLADSTQIERADKAEMFAMQSNNDSLIAVSYYIKGVVYYYFGYYKVSNSFYEKALELSSKTNDPNFSYKLFNNMGINFDMLGMPDESLKNYHKALDIVISNDDKRGIAQVKINIARLYRVTRDFDKSALYLNESLRYFENSGDNYYAGLINQNIASLLVDMKMAEDTVLAAFNTAMEYYDKIDYNYGKVELYHNLADYYLKVKNDNEQAKTYFEKALEISTENKTHTNSVSLLLAVAKIEMFNNQFESAEIHILNAINLAKTQNMISLRLAALRLLSQNYLKQKKNESAQETLNSYYSLSDSVSDGEKIKLLNELSVLYEVKVKNQQLEKNQIVIKNLRNKQFFLVTIVLLVFLLFIVIILFYRYKNSNLKQYFNLNKLLLEKDINFSIKIETENTNEAESKHLQLYNNLVGAILKDKLFADPNLTIDDLCLILYTNQKYISEAVNINSKTNFSNFLNKFRIEEARRLILNTGLLGLTLEQVMYQSGFKSRTTFNASFKKFTGMTPGQFKKQAEKNK